ncbi:MAG: pyruvate formate lyase-activating protein, partial [Thermoproteota archaeon]
MWLLRRDAVTVWDNREVNRRLSWYRAVMTNLKPAKFLIVRSIPANTSSSDLEEMREEELWRLHDNLILEFNEVYESIKGGKSVKLTDAEPSFLDVKIALSERIIEHCEFCERRCRANRKKGGLGFCRIGYKSRVSSWFH